MKRGSLWDTPHSTSLSCSLTSAEHRNVHNCLPCICTSSCRVPFEKQSGQITWCVHFLEEPLFVCAVLQPACLNFNYQTFATCIHVLAGLHLGGRGEFCSPSAGIGSPWNLYMLAHQIFRLLSPKGFNTQFLFPLNE